MTPFWAAANVVGGLILVMWIIAPIMCTPVIALWRMANSNDFRLHKHFLQLVHADTLEFGV